MKKTISGIRGVAGMDLDAGKVMEFCGSFARIAGRECVISMDTRPSGPALKDAAAAALMAGGVDVLDLGIAPTPAVFREARRYGAGIVVTSSHNPLEWNGLKFIVGGRGINESELQEILGHAPMYGRAAGQRQIETTYVDDAAEMIGMVDGAPRIAVDAGGGAAAGFAPKILQKMGCTVKVIHSERGPDPTQESLAELEQSGCEIGLAFDLDGDRLVLVINGKKQSPDVTLGLGVAGAMRAGCKRFVFSIDTSSAVERYVLDNGGKVWRSKVGEANVAGMIIERGAQAGGEGSSGGFIMPEFNYCRDGMFAGGMIASMSGTQEFKEMLQCMGRYVQKRTKITADSARHDGIMEKIESSFASEYPEIVTIDGVKGIDGNGWVLARKSNTEDIIRISAESDDEKKCAQVLRRAEEMVRDACT
ncbi:MAG: phosphomannomutase [Nitrosopumilus sp. B06]|nr:MAG: phosphomannomutase [Nitrosopumilus sp. B06]